MVLDESVRQQAKVITVGGFLAPTAALPEMAEGWRALKASMGLGPKDELKYAIYQDHPSYLRLEQGGWPRSRRLAAMLEWLTDQPVLLLADTVHDWRRPGDRAHVKDLYVHALGWCVRRAANHVEFDLRAPAGPHAVLVDMPNGVHRVSDDNRTWLLRSLGNSLATAAFALYQSRYLDPEPFPSGDGSALASVGFQPELHAAHAKHSDLLQVADLVAGCVSDLCAARLQHGPADASTWREDHFQLIAGQFRRHTDGRVISFGLDAFDPDGADPQLRDYLESLVATAGG
jgi:hypothetical protein